MKFLFLAFALVTLAAADTTIIPSLTDLGSASAQLILVVGFALFVLGKLVAGTLFERAEKRADAAIFALAANTTALEKNNDLVKANTEAVVKLVNEHDDERKAWASQLAELSRQK